MYSCLYTEETQEIELLSEMAQDITLDNIFISKQNRDYPGGPVAKTLPFQCKGPWLIPGWRTRSDMHN